VKKRLISSQLKLKSSSCTKGLVATISALLDACVLYPAQLRDLLLSFGDAELFHPVWSDMIHEEWITNVLANRPELTRRQLEQTRDAMNRAFPDASVRGFEPLMPTLVLPDPDDCHVLAAAIHARADLIITVNLKDFPSPTLLPLGVEAIHPDYFVDYLIDVDEDEAFAAVSKMRSRLRAPSMTPQEFIESIERAGLLRTASRLRANVNRV
jgi:predicted nucleic acid-binding protein